MVSAMAGKLAIMHDARSMKTVLSLFPLLLQLAVTGAFASGSERWHEERELEQREIQELVASGRILPLEQILARVMQKAPGRLLEVEFEREEDGLVYEIEFLSEDGQILELKVDAETGELMDREQEK